MANQYGVELGNTLLQAASIKKYQDEQKAQSLKNNLLSNFDPYNPRDRQRMLALDPGWMNELGKAMSQWDENKRKQAQDTAVRLAKIAAQALRSGNPAETWEKLKSDVPKTVQERMGEYSYDKALHMFYNALTMEQLAQNPVVRTFGDEYQLWGLGVNLGATPRDMDDKEEKRIEEFEIKAADENYILRSVVRQFGGVFDPTTNTISGLDPEQSAKARRLMAMASRIYIDNKGKLTRAEAVDKAFQVYKGNKDKASQAYKENEEKTLGIWGKK